MLWYQIVCLKVLEIEYTRIQKAIGTLTYNQDYLTDTLYNDYPQLLNYTRGSYALYTYGEADNVCARLLISKTVHIETEIYQIFLL